MKSVLVLTLAIAATCGSVEWRDFRAGNVKLPTNEGDAVDGGWKSLEEDKSLKLTWYSQDKDPRFMLGFDGRQKLAGLRVAFLKSDVDSAYTSDYVKSGLYEEGNFLGHPCFYATVILTPENVLKSGGRRSLADDEVALCANLKRHGKFKSLDRDGCEAAQGAVVEQGCQSGYGLVFSKFGSKSSCDSLAPFYIVYDPQGSGNMVGFGWLSFSKFSAADFKTKTFYKTLSGSDFSALFPKAPACLASYAQSKGLTAVDVWLSYDSSRKTSCSGSNWTDSHCQKKRSTRPGQFGTASEDFVDSEEA